MKLKNYQHIYKNQYFYLYLLGLVILIFLLIFRLGNLVGGMSQSEIIASKTSYGWHGIYNSVIYLPLKVLRSIDFKLFKDHGQTLTRLPNIVFGFLSVISFSYIVYIWHGKRTSLLSTFLFLTAAWTMHVSRLASYDIMFFWGIVSLLLTQVILSEYSQSRLASLFSYFIWGLLLTIPGFIYLLLIFFILEKDLIKDSWDEVKSIWVRVLSIVLLILWLPLLIKSLAHLSNLKYYLGFPNKLPSLTHYLKDFVGVFVHLFIRGPEYPYIWLGKSPILDFFVLILSILGIFFYFKHFNSNRAKLLFYLFIAGYILISFAGAVPLSLLVPLMYIFSATGMAYLLYIWFKVFPKNPLARKLAISLISIAVIFSCIYNLRAYFVAWKLDPTTRATFNQHLK